MQGLQIKNFDPKCVSTDPLVEDFYKALDANTMDKFLEERAGLWWYPILDSVEWLDMFQNASKCPMAKTAAAIFQDWVAEFKPQQGYTGWRGFSDSKTGLPPMTPHGTTAAATTPNPALSPTSYTQMKIEQASMQSASSSCSFFSPQVKSASVATIAAPAASTSAPPEAVRSSTQSTPSSPASCRNPKNTTLVAAFQELVAQYNKEQNYNAAATYRRVFQAVQDLDFEITKDNAKGLCKGKDKVASIGKASAEKIFEFVTMGTIAKLEEKRAAAQEAS